MKRMLAAGLLLLAPLGGCGMMNGAMMPAGVMNASNCQVSGAGSISSTLVGSGLNISFQCAGTSASPGATVPPAPTPVPMPEHRQVFLAPAAAVPVAGWPTPPALPMMPPLR